MAATIGACGIHCLAKLKRAPETTLSHAGTKSQTLTLNVMTSAAAVACVCPVADAAATFVAVVVVCGALFVAHAQAQVACGKRCWSCQVANHKAGQKPESATQKLQPTNLQVKRQKRHKNYSNGNSGRAMSVACLCLENGSADWPDSSSKRQGLKCGNVNLLLPGLNGQGLRVRVSRWAWPWSCRKMAAAKATATAAATAYIDFQFDAIR